MIFLTQLSHSISLVNVDLTLGNQENNVVEENVLHLENGYYHYTYEVNAREINLDVQNLVDHLEMIVNHNHKMWGNYIPS